MFFVVIIFCVFLFCHTYYLQTPPFYTLEVIYCYCEYELGFVLIPGVNMLLSDNGFNIPCVIPIPPLFSFHEV